jgi:hypothetical protein
MAKARAQMRATDAAFAAAISKFRDPSVTAQELQIQSKKLRVMQRKEAQILRAASRVAHLKKGQYAVTVTQSRRTANYPQLRFELKRVD